MNSMLKAFLLLTAFAISLFAHSQEPTITWGDEYKVRVGGGTKMKILAADSSGVYLQEKGVAMPETGIARLTKLDNNLHVVYAKVYSRELSGKNFEAFFALQDKLLIVSSDYHRKEKTFEIFAAEINGSSGELIGDWRSIANFKKEDRSQNVNFKLMPNADTSGFVIISSIASKEKALYQVQEFDKNLTAVIQPVTISDELGVKAHNLEDVLYTDDRKIILVGRILLYPEGKGKAESDLEIANYYIHIYDEHGQQIGDVNTNIKGRWLINTKVMLTKNKELVLAAFFSNSKKIGADGFVVMRIAPSTGKVLSATEKELNYTMLTADNTEGDNEDKPGQKEDESLPKYMTFRNIFHTADGGLVLLAENYKDDLDRPTLGWNFRGPSLNAGLKNNYFESGEVMMCKLDAGNNISWLHILPKAQQERLMKGLTDELGIVYNSAFFYESYAPFYCGFGAMQYNGKINIFFNDNPKNATVLQPGQKLYTAKKLWDSHCYRVTLNEVTGKYERNDFFNNSEVPTPMIKYAKVFGNTMYVVGKSPEGMGRTKLAVAKITF
jgi:hypothetical protein